MTPVRVALFVPCFLNHLRPDVALATARVLRRLGLDVTVPPGQTCCGQPAWNTGAREAALLAARHFLHVFERAALDPATEIVCPSGSCAAMVIHHYPRLPLAAEERALHARLAGRVWELSQFLVDRLGLPDLGDLARPARRVAVHRSCHALRLLGVDEQPRRILERVAGVELVELRRPRECCGFGGTFAVKLPEVSVRMADDKLDDALSVGAEEIVGIDTSCLEHLAGRARRRGLEIRCLHLAEVLAEGMGLA